MLLGVPQAFRAGSLVPGIEGLTPLGCPEDIVPAILGVAGRIVARAADDALVLRGTIGHGLRLLVDDALRGGVHAGRPRPELEPEARRLVALDRNDLRRLAESAIGQRRCFLAIFRCSGVAVLTATADCADVMDRRTIRVIGNG